MAWGGKSGKRKPGKNRLSRNSPPKKGKGRRGAVRILGAMSVLAALAGVAILADRADRFLTTSPWFQIRTVEVVGEHALREEEIRSLVGISPGAGLFGVDLREAAGRIKKHPWVREVTVRREFPHTLRIVVRERVPVAHVNQKDRFYLADREGIVMGEARGYSWSLPVVYGVDLRGVRFGEGPPSFALREAIAVRESLAAEPELARSSYVGIEVKSGGDVVLHLEEMQVRLGRGGYREKMRRLREIEKEVQEKGVLLKEVDLRYGEQVVVRAL
ncbi:MAG: FtsQ-type POTRA domain-containing protein [Nitrospirae bacterium]|nr:FtsQ-type POTRA domain-containing protein [Nitrospirota bacterium]